MAWACIVDAYPPYLQALQQSGCFFLLILSPSDGLLTLQSSFKNSQSFILVYWAFGVKLIVFKRTLHCTKELVCRYSQRPYEDHYKIIGAAKAER